MAEETMLELAKELAWLVHLTPCEMEVRDWCVQGFPKVHQG
jgi:hypothetical protein